MTQPTNYKLTKVEQVYDDAGSMKAGQYRAYITDQKLSKSYDEQMALVLTITNANGEKMQISSSVNGDEKMSFDAAIDRMVKAYEEKLSWLNAQITAM